MRRKDGQPQQNPRESISQLEFSSPPLEGFLLKKGAKGIRGWKRRWFTLSNDRLMYYKNSSGIPGSEQGFIDLSGDYEIEYEGEVNSRNFRIKTSNRIWYLLAEAEEERRFWVEGLNYFKKRQQREKQNLNNPFTQSVSKTSAELFGSENTQNYTEEELIELQQLMLDAEKEIEAKQSHINELNSDLQNSIQIIKAKGEQVELLQERLNAKENQNKELLEGNIQLREEISKLRKIISQCSPDLLSLSKLSDTQLDELVINNIEGEDDRTPKLNDNEQIDNKNENDENDDNNDNNKDNNDMIEDNKSEEISTDVKQIDEKQSEVNETTNGALTVAHKLEEISKNNFNFDSERCMPEVELLEGQLKELKSLFSYNESLLSNYMKKADLLGQLIDSMSRYLDRYYSERGGDKNNAEKGDGTDTEDEKIKTIENWVKWAVYELESISTPAPET